VDEDWIVRVDGREYGPVKSDTLREWRLEGRLIPTNEIRRVGDEHWIHASELAEVFTEPESARAEPPPLPVPVEDYEKPRTWREILAETFRVYRSGFWRLILFGLLTSVPLFILQWTFPQMPLPSLTTGSPSSMTMPTLPAITQVMLVLVILVWPISAVGFQFVADDIVRGRVRSFGGQFSTGLNYWARMLIAAILVYGSYFFWTLLPFTAVLAFRSSGNPALGSLMVFLIGGFMIYIVARLFVNFLFWQQTVTLGAHPPLLALRESKELARSVPEAPPFERPLYRGVIISSGWLLVLLVLTFGVQLPFTMVRLMGAQNLDETIALMKKMAESQTSDGLMLAAAIATAAVNLLLRPLLSVVFVVLYYDAKARSGRMNDGEAISE